MPQHDARQREQDRRAVREVAEHERVGNATVLVDDDQVGHLVRAARVGEFVHDVVTAVDPGRVGHAEAEFLCDGGGRRHQYLQRLSEPAVGTAARLGARHTFANCCSFEDGSREVVMRTRGSSMPAWAYSSSMWVIGAVRAVQVSPTARSRSVGSRLLTILRRVHLELPLSRSMAARDLLPLGEQVADGLLPLPDLLLFLFERFGVEELATFAGFTADLLQCQERALGYSRGRRGGEEAEKKREQQGQRSSRMAP